MNKISLIHCLENKFNHKFERQSKLYLESFKNLNRELYENVSIHFMQPNKNDIKDETINYFKNNKVHFYKEYLTEETEGINYFNKVWVCEWFSKNLKTEFMCFLDNDIIFLKNIKKELFKTIEKPVICVELLNQNIEEIYFKYYRNHLKKEYQLKNLNYHVNTWFIYAKRLDPIWKKWSDLTKDLQKVNNKEQEIICEELAMTILFCQNPNNFISMSNFFEKNQMSMINTGDNFFDLRENTEIFHYTDIFEKSDIEHEIVQGEKYEYEITKILHIMFKKKFIDEKIFIKLIKKMKE